MMKTAEDIHGQTVTVLPHYEVGGTRLDQYIYETSCEQEDTQCHGIDSRHFTSKCQTNYAYAFARVINKLGEIGWVMIKIRASCNCALTRKGQHL